MKKNIVITFFLVFHVLEGHSQLLIKADSLYKLEKFSRAKALYQSILGQQKQFSEAMLLKLAVIADKENNFTENLYYLSLYFARNPVNVVKQQILNLAEKHNLSGFQFGEFDTILYWFHSYYEEITSSALVLLGIIAFGIIYRRFKNAPLVFLPLFFSGMLLVSAALVNIDFIYKRAIIKSDYTYLYQGPAAGSKVIGIIAGGNRVLVREHIDIWYKVLVDDKEAFINEHNLYLLEN